MPNEKIYVCMALMKALSRNTKKTKHFSCRRCRTLDLNDFRFLHNFIELEWLSGIIGESVDHEGRGYDSGQENIFNSPIVVAHS